MGVMNEDRLTLYDGLIKTHITNTTVAKETGKGLSTNDYTTTEKNKLAGIANGANKTIVDGSLSYTSTNPVQNKVVNTEFGKKLNTDGDSKDLTNTFVSQDSTNVTQWTNVDVLTSGEKHSSVFNKISTMFKNIRYLYKMLGTADISTLGEGANIGTVTGAISKLNSDFEDLFIENEGAGLHNSIYRGKNLGSSFTDIQKAQVHAGTFHDMWIGDYWVIGGVKYRIAHFDYWLNCGGTQCTQHHVVIVPDSCLYSAQMNDTNITTGAYVGSKMYTENLAQAKEIINNAFGSSNILNHQEFLANATKGTTDPTYESACSWYDSTVDLMNECMVYGSNIFHNVEANGAIPYSYTVDKSQLALFKLDPSKICNRVPWWLRDVVSAAYFAFVNYDGYATCYNASSTIGVRPAFGITA